MVLSEKKIYGIPNIIIGLDYIFNAKGGTIIVYDDKPESLASEAIKIIKKSKPESLASEAIKIIKKRKYRKNLGKRARISMKKFNNDMLLNDWIELILSIYKGQQYYDKLREDKKKLSQNDGINILDNQIKLKIDYMNKLIFIDRIKNRMLKYINHLNYQIWKKN